MTLDSIGGIIKYLYTPWIYVAFLICVVNGPVRRFLKGRRTHFPKYSCVLITGCDSGFGLQMSIKLKRLGYVVVSTCLTERGTTHLSETYGINSIQIDLSKEGAYDLILNKVQEVLYSNPGARLWALVNNAGIAPVGFLDWTPVDTFRNAMEVNYFAPVGVTRAVLQLLKQYPGSRVINLSSVAGLLAGANFGPYSGSKHALEGFAKALRQELRPFDVYVCNVNPGFMATPLIETSLNHALKAFETAPAEIKRFYTPDALSGSAQQLLRIQESPSVVVDYIVDHLITCKNPDFNNCVGWQAFLMQGFLLLPYSLQELLMVFSGNPSTTVDHDVLRAYQGEASVAAAKAADLNSSIMAATSQPRKHRPSAPQTVTTDETPESVPVASAAVHDVNNYENGAHNTENKRSRGRSQSRAKKQST